MGGPSKEKILKYAKEAGFRGRANNNFRLARKRVYKALSNATYDRHAKRWDFRKLWIQRMNAAARQHGLSYSRMQHAMRVDNVQLNRKVLSELAVNEPLSFRSLVLRARDVLHEVEATRASERVAVEERRRDDVKAELLGREAQLSEEQRAFLQAIANGRA